MTAKQEGHPARPDAGSAPPLVVRANWFRRHEGLLITVGSLLAFFTLWQVLELFVEMSPSMFATPLEVGAALAEMTMSGDLFRHVQATGMLFLSGFVLAAVVGVSLGLLLGSNEDLEAVFGPYLMAIYAAPRVAFMPLLLVWFGIGLVSQVMLVFLSALFPIVISTLTGAKNVDRVLLKTARSFGASKVQVFSKVVLPFAVPSIIAGFRLGIGRALIGAFVAEMFGASAGLGYLIIRAGFELKPDVLLGSVLVLAVLSLLLTEGVRWIGARVAPWQRDAAL